MSSVLDATIWEKSVPGKVLRLTERLQYMHARQNTSSQHSHDAIEETQRTVLTMIDLPALLGSFRRALGAGCGRRLVVLRRAVLGRIGLVGVLALDRGLGRRHTSSGGSIGRLCSVRHQR